MKCLPGGFLVPSDKGLEVSDDSDDDEEYIHPAFVVMEQHANMIRDRQEMHGQALRHDIHGFIEALNRAELEAFAKIMSYMSTCEDPRHAASYFQGVISALLKCKFNVCMGCGKDHDEEFHNLTTTED